MQTADLLRFNNEDDRALTYYANWACDYIYTDELLRYGDGQCGAWARFFIDMLAVQGIEHQNEYVVLYYDNSAYPPNSLGFLVKNWTFAPGGGVSGDPALPYLNVVYPDGHYIAGNVYDWNFAQVNDASGIPGQGPTLNPASLFNNHQVVKINGVYFDPSYGETFNTLAEIDQNAIDGHYVAQDDVEVDEGVIDFDLNGDGDKTDVLIRDVFMIDSNPSGNQLREVSIEYP